MPKDDLCRACFDGVYPIALPEPELLGKHLLEDRAGVVDAGAAADASRGRAAAAAPDALTGRDRESEPTPVRRAA